MFNFNRHHERITKIIGEQEEPLVTSVTLKIYRDYLDMNISLPCYLTGQEDFNWEEFYVLGPGDKEEYEQLKKTKASYTDTFNLLSFYNKFTEEYGILVKVQRISDNKKFILSLSDLVATDKKTNNYSILRDYSAWFVNYH